MILKKIRTTLKKEIDLKYKEGATNFFKEKVNFLGVRTPIVRKIAREYWHKIKHLPKKEIFKLSEELIKTPYNEEAHIGFQWIYKIHDQYNKSDITFFEKIVKKYLTNWGHCDDFCTHVLAEYFLMYPEQLHYLHKWTKSKNMWVRRCAAVSLVMPAKKGYFHKQVYEIADILMMDKEDLVQKAYGWMLKVAADFDQETVFKYVLKHKQVMPRTALRYAIEKMPKNKKEKAMEK